MEESRLLQDKTNYQKVLKYVTLYYCQVFARLEELRPQLVEPILARSLYCLS